MHEAYTISLKGNPEHATRASWHWRQSERKELVETGATAEYIIDSALESILQLGPRGKEGQRISNAGWIAWIKDLHSATSTNTFLPAGGRVGL